MAIQFLIVLAVSRKASLEVSGAYFLAFGWISSTYFLSGLGLPDGLVRELALLLARDDSARARKTIEKSAFIFALTLLIPFTATAALASHLNWGPSEVIFVSLWWASYAVMFFVSQCLLSLGSPALASFFFYPAVNISLTATLIPYLLISSQPTFRGISIAASIGGVVMAALGSGLLASKVAKLERAPLRSSPVMPIMSFGLKIAIGRVIQTVIYWLPVWAAGATLGAAAAGVIGLASRLNNAIAAVMAAIRFIVRPGLVRALEKRDFAGITNNARLISTIASGLVVGALACYLLIGKFLLKTIFGPDFVLAFVPLAILLVGTIGEAAGGIVDEILKMAGETKVVLSVLACVTACEAIICLFVAKFGLLALATTQSAALLTLYGALSIYARSKLGVTAAPFVSVSALTRAWKHRASGQQQYAEQ